MIFENPIIMQNISIIILLILLWWSSI